MDTQLYNFYEPLIHKGVKIKYGTSKSDRIISFLADGSKYFRSLTITIAIEVSKDNHLNPLLTIINSRWETSRNLKYTLLNYRINNIADEYFQHILTLKITKRRKLYLTKKITLLVDNLDYFNIADVHIDDLSLQSIYGI